MVCLDAPPIWLPSRHALRGRCAAKIGSALTTTTVAAPPIVFIVAGIIIGVPRGVLLEVLGVEHLIELELQGVRAIAHVVLTRALTPGLPPREVRSHPDLMGPAIRRFQRFPIRCNLDGPATILLEDLTRNRKGAPAPLMRDRHFGPPPSAVRPDFPPEAGRSASGRASRSSSRRGSGPHKVPCRPSCIRGPT